MANFILVHGAFHGGWCWERLVPLLQAAGHSAQAPDLLGMGDDKTPLAQVTLHGWAEQIANIARAAPGQSILVGHSRGGTVVSQAAELVAKRLDGIIYLTAALTSPLMPPDQAGPIGKGLGDCSARINAAVSADGASMMVDRTAAVALLYNRTDAVWQKRAGAALCPEPLAPNMEPLKLTAENWGSLRRAYIVADDDRVIPPDLQILMHTATPCDPVLTLDSDHSPFFSMPEALAGSLIEIAEAWAK